ncbi:hypothetical protein AVEN_181675-1 [Araneus ventricosus]|uniref:Uncharacterized protein n=1 Tax=Araneus ventricosus TaxID=182803 RepID=A0A4Y2WK00_ARAVE|nr:hypothetical protein AVEN_70628-1 [Araneus ventricosus]GBO36924.1 hypothetical protein AVEN_181675-1 [Araneus ventricosus]
MVSASGRRVTSSKPDLTKDSTYMSSTCVILDEWEFLVHAKSTGSNVLPLVWCGSLERGVPALVSSLPSDRGSYFRGPSQTRERSMTKLNCTINS